jgi:hypothetical protein
VHREYIRGPDLWVVSVDGAVVHQSGGRRSYENPRQEPCGDGEAAIARAEQRIAEQVGAGFRLRIMELLGSVRWHETPPFTPSADPFTAVDAAVERIRRLVREPRGHFLVEELDPARAGDAQRLQQHGHGKFFIDLHSDKFGRWAELPDLPRTGSSLDYFFARYGSLTWIVSGAIADGLPMFLCGNLSGGGWCCLELDDLDYDTSGAADCHPDRGYESGRVFHGGWGDSGYIMDTRVASASGEHPIYAFCDDGPIDESDQMPEQPDQAAPIEPFGFWLERHVHELVSEIEHRLPFVN